MFRLTMILWAIASAIVLSACSVVGQPVAEKVADAVTEYCKEPYGQRQVYRQTVNAELYGDGHAVQVNCAGDPPEE